MHTRRCLILGALATLYTLLNFVKPLQVDDAAYYYYASQIAKSPFDPYGFQVFWYQHPDCANHVLAPPVLPYWWAAGITLFGDQPFLWKLGLWPIALLFVFALHAVFRRFIYRLALPLTCMTVFSPTFLPSLNYMLDVPAIALGLASLAVFFRACDYRDFRRAVMAGVLAGLAMETKYTAFLVPATMALYAGIPIFIGAPGSLRKACIKIALCVVAVGLAVGMFAAWEHWIAGKYGDSHFMIQVREDNRDPWQQLTHFTAPLLLLIGSVGAGIGLVGLHAFCRRAWCTLAASATVSLAFIAVAWGGSSFELTGHHALPLPAEWSDFPISLEETIFFVLGFATCVVVLAVAGRLVWRPHAWFRGCVHWFLVLWLVLEIAGFFALTPFPAVRRVMGIVVVGTLLVGRLAAFSLHSSNGRFVVRCITVGNVILGFVFYGVDLRDAWAQKMAAERAAAWIRQTDPDGTIWFTGHWGFQFYAERAGMKPLIPDNHAHPLRRNDWLVVPENRFEQQSVHIDPKSFERKTTQSIDDHVPLRTVSCFYGTHNGVAIEHHSGPRMTVTIYRVQKGVVPRSP